jgi:hypothetical protein
MSLRCFNPQFFIGSRVGDAALESEQKVSSYEHRLEVLIEAVKVLAALVPADTLTTADQLALEKLRALGPMRGERDTPHDALPPGGEKITG